MNLHITPSFIIDRLCKTASVLLFLVPAGSRPNVLYKHVGDLLSLNCNDTGSHDIKWTTPRGERLGNPFTLQNIQMSDNGNYECYYCDGPTPHNLDSYYVNVTSKHTYFKGKLSNVV